MAFTRRPVSGCAQSLEPVGPNAWSAQSTACAPPVSAGSTAPCDCCPKFPRRMRSSHDPQAGAGRDRATHARFEAPLRTHVQWHARLYGRAPAPAPVFEELTYPAFLAASHFEGG